VSNTSKCTSVNVSKGRAIWLLWKEERPRENHLLPRPQKGRQTADKADRQGREAWSTAAEGRGKEVSED
jgi:hypothetical protein